MTARYAVIGDPIAQSLSPEIHSAWIAHYGLDAEYTRVHVPAGTLKDALERLHAEGYAGLNVTMPHKAEAVALAESTTGLVRRIGAANTLIRSEQGWSADNTDIEGFRVAADAFLPEDAIRPDPDQPVVVIGAGGAAPAALFWASGRGLPVLVLNRTLAKAEDLVAGFGAEDSRAGGLDQLGEALERASMVINCISFVAAGETLDFPQGDGRPMMDISYGKSARPTIEAAETAGWRVKDGLHMLVAQAAASFQLWTGVKPDPELAFASLNRRLQA